VSTIHFRGHKHQCPHTHNSHLLSRSTHGENRTLTAKKLPINAKRVSELPFDAVVLGENQSENTDGGFADKPAGKWTVIKLFLPVGGDEGEVFLGINPTAGKGEFSMKDEEYGDYLLKEFARVL